MLHNFGLYKRPLLTVLAVLLTTAFTTASAAMIDLSQSSTSNEAPTLAPETNMEPVIKVAATPTSTPISGAPEKATINTSSTSHDGHLENFPSRKVTIVVPANLRNENTAQFGRYMTDRLSNTLKYPYYDTTIVSTNTPTAEIKAADMYKLILLIAQIRIIRIIMKFISPQRLMPFYTIMM
ncbi:MAG: hypothetical protein E7J73_04845 [Veillonella sp.]|nr:hypothetical protein [Veillonella sp.]